MRNHFTEPMALSKIDSHQVPTPRIVIENSRNFIFIVSEIINIRVILLSNKSQLATTIKSSLDEDTCRRLPTHPRKYRASSLAIECSFPEMKNCETVKMKNTEIEKNCETLKMKLKKKLLYIFIFVHHLVSLSNSNE